MAHDTHFLQRLVRISDEQVSFAMSLYRDTGLMRRVLALAALPDDVERVAIALEREDPTAHLVIARDGGFVTCLAAGMSTGSWPVLSREQLDGLVVRAERGRQVEQLRADAADRVDIVARRLLSSADCVSREDFEAAAAFRELLLLDYARIQTRLFERTRSEIKRLYKVGKRRQTPRQKRELRRFYNEVWSVGHLSLLVNLDTDLLAVLPEPDDESMRYNPSWPCTRQRFGPTLLRGMWCAAKLGRALFSGYKERYRSLPTVQGSIDSAMAIAVIGLRHRKLRAEALKLLSRETSLAENKAHFLDDPRVALNRTFMDNALVAILEAPDEHLAFHRALGRELATRLAVRADGPYHFDAPEDVPDEIALALVANTPAEVFTRIDTRGIFLSMLPWLAQAEAAELYLPEAFLQQFNVMEWTPALSLELIEADRSLEGPATVRKPRAAGRNDPCSCGSGRKYKHCCGGKTPAPAA